MYKIEEKYTKYMTNIHSYIYFNLQLMELRKTLPKLKDVHQKYTEVNLQNKIQDVRDYLKSCGLSIQRIEKTVRTFKAMFNQDDKKVQKYITSLDELNKKIVRTYREEILKRRDKGLPPVCVPQIEKCKDLKFEENFINRQVRNRMRQMPAAKRRVKMNNFKKRMYVNFVKQSKFTKFVDFFEDTLKNMNYDKDVNHFTPEQLKEKYQF